jgi:hypothetical protein
MPEYKVLYKEFHKLTVTKSQTFDTSDQNAWDNFLNNAIELNDVDPDEFPKEAPSDPEIWFDLISRIDTTDYDNHDEDVWTRNTGDYETSFELEDEEGNVISSF